MQLVHRGDGDRIGQAGGASPQASMLSFPAAATTVTPWSMSAWKAASIDVSPAGRSVVFAPKLRFATAGVPGVRFAAIQSAARMMSDSLPRPVQSRTLSGTRVTPFEAPSVAPVMRLDTAVPWPAQSSGVGGRSGSNEVVAGRDRGARELGVGTEDAGVDDVHGHAGSVVGRRVRLVQGRGPAVQNVEVPGRARLCRARGDDGVLVDRLHVRVGGQRLRLGRAELDDPALEDLVDDLGARAHELASHLVGGHAALELHDVGVGRGVGEGGRASAG